ncbi:type VI secretion system Vgr family protein [Rhodocyclus purpureus]|uniref:type VI secretion system Vgr family protein n=1 Tax=Rhodocyclus purpureus TaxID=1067 RepID=UPI0019134B83|nr:type VI secretion system tip protein TssI/VgrG [Rhodocyclus purpureus]MBK5914544.1 type VI secretion protein ImpA [Rhodocyclus purpureus]
MQRLTEISTPLGKDILLFHSLSAREELGRLFEYRISVLSMRNDVDPGKLLGKNVTVKLALADGAIRHFDCCVTRFAFVGMLGAYLRYEIVGYPWLWFLTRSADCRIFQNKKVPDIIQDIFAKYANAVFKLDKLTGTYRTWEYCVQYRESDFNFVSRLLEQEGIYYYFTHEDGKHTLVLADSPGVHDPFPGYDEIPFIHGERVQRVEQEHLWDWGFSWEVQPGAYVIDDFDFKKPAVELLQQTEQERSFAESGHEIYDYPGEYEAAADGDNYVRIRLEELQAQVQSVQGTGNARGIAVGSVFRLSGQPREDQNRSYLVTAASFNCTSNLYQTTPEASENFTVSFTCINSDAQFRTSRITPKPIVQGLQTAIVVGPAGDEIYTDQYGRVKLHFHWDRHGKDDENASCWIRVAHPWAGKNFGMVAVPRIGQEVLVEFLEGDPDRPLISGRVYNADQMPPWALPANKTQTGALTRSSLGGSAANANAIRFEDKKGSEQLWIHAEKNQDIEVENDETHWVGHDRSKTIDHDETTEVKHDRTETVDNDETITIHNCRSERVDVNEKISIGANRNEDVGVNETIAIGANRSISVGANETATVALQRTHSVGVNETIAVGAAQEIAIGAYQTVNVGANQDVNVGAARSVNTGANLSTTVGADESRSVTGARSTDIGKDDALKVGKNLVIDAGDSVTIKTGSASISMKKDGTIVIKGKDITVDGSGKINVKASGNIVMKGSKILQN